MKKINNDSVVLRFVDSENNIIEVDIDMLLTGGVPIDTDTGDDLEFIGTYLIDESVPSGNYIFTDKNGIDSLV